MDAALDPALLARFEADFLSLCPQAGRTGLAVSGGPDSMALLILAHACFADRIEVATVDHGLRREAAEECALVARVCAERSIRCEILSVTVSEGNVQDRARAARYSALGQWAVERELGAVATAHHADDQAETLLMRLNRGSGLAGLAGIRSSTLIDGCAVPVIRPLLMFRKSELRAVVKRAGVRCVEDPSNRDASYERVRIRRQLEQADWIDPLALARSAAHLEEAERTLEALARELWDSTAVVEQARVTLPATPTPDTNARLVSRAITLLGGTVSHGEVAAFLKAGERRGNIAGVLVDRRSDSYICTPEPPRRSG